MVAIVPAAIMCDPAEMSVLPFRATVVGGGGGLYATEAWPPVEVAAYCPVTASMETVSTQSAPPAGQLTVVSPTVMEAPAAIVVSPACRRAASKRSTKAAGRATLAVRVRKTLPLFPTRSDDLVKMIRWDGQQSVPVGQAPGAGPVPPAFGTGWCGVDRRSCRRPPTITYASCANGAWICRPFQEHAIPVGELLHPGQYVAGILTGYFSGTISTTRARAVLSLAFFHQ